MRLIFAELTWEMFIGRDHERGILEEAIASDRAELGIVYGRRRIGKSTLLQSVCRRGDLFFEGLQGASMADQIEHFMKQLAEQTDTPVAVANSWRDAFAVLTRFLEKKKKKGLYVVLDEFPWMTNGRTEPVSLLKYFWDNHWKKNPKLTLVLCGSVAQFMINHIVHSKALHNRKTFEIRLPPLGAGEAKEFFKDYRSDIEIARFLMVFGGVPKYLEQIDPKRSLAENMDALAFTGGSYFIEEFDTIFKEQFKVTKSYETLVKILASRSISPEGLAKEAGMASGGGFNHYLTSLEQADFIKIFHPTSISGAGSRTRRVYLWDNWLSFYFSFVEPNKKVIALNQGPGLFERLTEGRFPGWCGFAFEKLCLQNIPGLLRALDIPLYQLEDYGPFFRQPGRNKKGAGVQIDLLLKRKGDILTLIECKFKTTPVGIGVVSDVKKKIERLEAPRRFSVERVLLSAGEVSREVENSGYFHRILRIDALYH